MKIQKRIQLLVPRGQEKVRIDKYLASHIQNSSRTKIQNAIENGWVRVNDKVIKSNYNIAPKDNIQVELPEYPEKFDILPELFSRTITC